MSDTASTDVITRTTESKLWAVHLEGPDDVYPAPTKEEAEAACTLINAAVARQTGRSEAPMVTAKAIVWPGSIEAWANEVHQFNHLFLR